MRSWLFVPGDSERKLARAFDAGADVVILDLEDSVTLERKAIAREMVREALGGTPDGSHAAVRINALTTPDAMEDLAAVARAAPYAIVLPKSERGADVGALAAHLAVAEAENSLPHGATRIMAIATETPAALFGLGTYRHASPRLVALAWGGEDLSAAIGATRRASPDGRLTDAFRLARTVCLLGAHAADVAPIDTVHTALADDEGLANECADAAADGFLGKMAIHPRQVPVINEAFTPSGAALIEAQAIIAAFEANPTAGVLAVDGQMVDRPHLERARRVLARATRLQR